MRKENEKGTKGRTGDGWREEGLRMKRKRGRKKGG